MLNEGLRSLSSLEGRWCLKRRISHAAGDVQTFDGEACFIWSGPRMIEEQVGELNMGAGTKLKATRRYVWTTEGDRIEVLFDDMRPFHTIPLKVDRPETTHICPPDRYHVAYDFSTWPDWTAVWDVEGPKKNYRMLSRYLR